MNLNWPSCSPCMVSVDCLLWFSWRKWWKKIGVEGLTLVVIFFLSEVALVTYLSRKGFLVRKSDDSRVKNTEKLKWESCFRSVKSLRSRSDCQVDHRTRILASNWSMYATCGSQGTFMVQSFQGWYLKEKWSLLWRVMRKSGKLHIISHQPDYPIMRNKRFFQFSRVLSLCY